MIKAVLFDFGGVIHTETEILILDDISKKCNVSKKKTTEAFNKLKSSFESGKLTEKVYWEKFSKITGCEFPKDYKNLWLNVYKKVSKEVPHVRKFAKTLRKKGYKTPLLSNTVISHVKYNLKHKRYRNFKPLFLSTKMGFRKPQLGIYKLAIKKLKLKPKECVFLDDRFENIKAARKVGMQGIVFKNLNQAKKELKKLEVEF